MVLMVLRKSILSSPRFADAGRGRHVTAFTVPSRPPDGPVRPVIWNLYSIVYMEYPGYLPIIYRETIYLRYIPGIYPGLMTKAIFLLVSMHVSLA